MKKFLPQQGGHRLYNDDFVTMQQGYEEALAAICKMFKRTNNITPVTMFGLEMTTLGTVTYFTKGAIFFNDEIFKIDDFNFNSIDYSNIFIKILEEEIPDIDPIEYKDTSWRHFIHVNRILISKIFNPADNDIEGVNGFYLRNLTQIDTIPKGVFADWLPENDLDFANCFDSTGLGIGRMSGWAICNGNNGTPDLRGQYTVMASSNMRSTNSLQTIAIQNVIYATRLGQRSTNIILQQINLPNYNLTVIDPGHAHGSYEWPNESNIGQGGTNASRNGTRVYYLSDLGYTNISVNSGGSNSPISINTIPPSFSMIKIKKIR